MIVGVTEMKIVLFFCSSVFLIILEFHTFFQVVNHLAENLSTFFH